MFTHIWCFAPTRGHWGSAHLFGFWCHSEPERVINRAVCRYNNPIWDVFIERECSPVHDETRRVCSWITGYWSFWNDFGKPSGTDQLTGGHSLKRCSNHLHPGLWQLPHCFPAARALREWEKARESQSLHQRPPRPSIWQPINWERKESTRSHFSLPFVRLELCRDGHVWTMNARMSGSACCVSNWRDLMIVLEHIVYLYVHILLRFYFIDSLLLDGWMDG